MAADVIGNMTMLYEKELDDILERVRNKMRLAPYAAQSAVLRT